MIINNKNIESEQEYKEEIIEHLEKSGWKNIRGKDLNIENDCLIIKDIFINKIKEINKNKELTDEDIKNAYNMFKSAISGKDILRYLKEGLYITLEKTKIKENIKLIDYENIGNNEFIVSDEVPVITKNGERRLDLVFFINGIPIIIAEIERPSYNKWEDGFNQLLNVYIYELQNCIKFFQMGMVIADKIYSFPIDEKVLKDIISNNIQNLKSKRTILWKPDNNRNTNDLSDILNATLEIMINRENLLKIIKYYIVYNKEEKILPRYPQFYTSEKLYKKIEERLFGNPEDKSYLVWHYQGSGKSLLMYYLAEYILKKLKRGNNIKPVVIILVDRLELKDQIFQLFNSMKEDLGFPVEEVNLKQLIEERLRYGIDPQPGIYILTIQKFRDIKNNTITFEDQLESILLSENEIMQIKNRKDIFIFIDEAHRSIYGKLGKKLFDIFSNSFYIAFTGTPAISKDINTLEKFKVVDTYFVSEAESDGVVVPILYKPEYDVISLTKNLLKEKENVSEEEYEEVIKKFLEKEDYYDIEDFLENPEYISDRDIKRLLNKINKINLIFKNPDRINKVTDKIADHFKKEVEPLGFKGLIIAPSRKIAVIYAKKLKEKLGKDSVEALITYNEHEDDVEILEYLRDLQERYTKGSIRDYNQINEEIKNRFKEDENPKILVVVNKLTTGFDLDKIQTIYLDRPVMTYHTLLQIIGRCNRRYSNKKYGLVVDFVGIIDVLRRAFELYINIQGHYQEISKYLIKDIDNIEKDIENILNLIDDNIFKKIQINLSDYIGYYQKNKNEPEEIKNRIDNIVGKIISGELMNTFFSLFKEFEKIYISPAIPLNLREKYKDKFMFLYLICLSLKKIKENRKDGSQEIGILEGKIEQIIEEFKEKINIEKFLTLEEEDIENIRKSLNNMGENNEFIILSSLIDNYNEIGQNKDRVNMVISKISKSVAVLENEEDKKITYRDIIEKIFDTIRKYNEGKLNGYKTLETLKTYINKIYEYEKTRKESKLSDEELYLYKILDDLNLDQKIKDINIVKDIIGNIREVIEENKNKNDFCDKLVRNIRENIVLNLNKLESNKREEIIKKLKEYYANIYPECREKLLS
ncbi:type I restriction-modification system, restriction subunit R [Nanobdella aerobiophila]|uniref:type I site-specific deoxyribonuclease n=1 Tax=Nanobdella aerobiophila TaxID=2586965 RepID=A0A915T064_9ARCH|nr:HsdR family type I site-specific deoxyribonuclease [Nanobdella aerobiophila]BBL45739.1 type I restriction-modification system, restriction subunit R [Nanobdella aerobiophila]